MGGCVSSGSSKSKVRGTLKLVLLGTQGTGKSTFHKQMKMIYSPNETEETIETYKMQFTANLLLGLKDLSTLLEDKEIKISEKAKLAEQALNILGNIYEVSMDSPVLVNARTFWEDASVQRALLNPKNSNYSEYSVSLKYIMDNWDRMTSSDWSPTSEDLLMVRARTSGFLETNVQVKDYIWKLIDVGGQRVERKKWPAITAGLNGILFFASLNDYDAEAEVPNMRTRMHESLAVWREVLLSEDASYAPIILFLNKKDLFEKRISECPIQDTWPDFDPRTDGTLFNAGVTFFMSKYLHVLNDPNCKVHAEFVYVHVTCALDTNQMRVVSSSIRDFVVQQRLKLVEAM